MIVQSYLLAKEVYDWIGWDFSRRAFNLFIIGLVVGGLGLTWRWLGGIDDRLTEIRGTVLEVARLANIRLEPLQD
jgi:hypothetical protein